MRKFPAIWTRWAAACLACLFPAAALLAAEPVTRREAMQIAASYQLFAWTPTERNIIHGNDRHGVRVDTPDATFQRPGTRSGWWVPGRKNIGVPYMWGGFSSLREFADGIKAGRYAGDVYTAEKRAGLDEAVSQEAVGIDCSGLISRCWKLPRCYSTRTLPSLCAELATYEDLKPGDILNSHNNHVLLFAGWQDDKHLRLVAYEAGSPPTWKVLLNSMPVEMLRSHHYRPYRYRQMHDS